MARWLKINGTDYNLDVVGAFSFDEFKKEGKHGFSKGVSDDDLKAVHKQLKAVHGMTEAEVSKLAKKDLPVLKGGAGIALAGEANTVQNPGTTDDPASRLVYSPEQANREPEKPNTTNGNTGTVKGASASTTGKGSKPGSKGTTGNGGSSR